MTLGVTIIPTKASDTDKGCVTDRSSATSLARCGRLQAASAAPTFAPYDRRVMGVAHAGIVIPRRMRRARHAQGWRAECYGGWA